MAVAVVALGQPSAVLDDLEARAVRALNGIHRAETWPQAQKSRNDLRKQLERAIGLHCLSAGREISAFVYAPKNTTELVPGVVIVRPHTDPAANDAALLPTALAQLGMLVVEVDARSDHSAINQFGEGITPQGLMQQDVRSVLAWLRANPAVDAKRLALIGEGLAGTIAAAINAEVSAIVVLDGAPDFLSLVKELRASTADQLPDSCVLIPGVLRHAASQEVLALIAPRPLLLLNAAEGPRQYATDLYRMAGEAVSIHHISESGWTSPARLAACGWLARQLKLRSDLADFVPPAQVDKPSTLKVMSDAVSPLTERRPLTEQLLSSLLGVSLPVGKFTYGLDCHAGPAVYGLTYDSVNFYPQAGIRVPVTTLRPTGCVAARGTLIAIDDRGRHELVKDEIVQEANRRGWMVWMLDPRYVGEMAVPRGPFASVMSLLLGEDTSWRQAHDILRTLRHVRDSKYPAGIYARGPMMGIAASYVAAIAESNELHWTLLRDGPSTFREIAVPPFGVFAHFDIPDLWQAARGEVHVIRSPDEFISKEW